MTRWRPADTEIWRGPCPRTELYIRGSRFDDVVSLNEIYFVFYVRLILVNSPNKKNNYSYFVFVFFFVSRGRKNNTICYIILISSFGRVCNWKNTLIVQNVIVYTRAFSYKRFCNIFTVHFMILINRSVFTFILLIVRER